MSLQRRLIAADGYCELGMPDEALRELSRLDQAEQRSHPAMEMKLKIAMEFRRWELGLAACAALATAFPEDTSAFVQGAYCLHALDRTADARDMLRAGPAALLQDPTYHYNLGCYEAVLGNLDAARDSLLTSFEMDKKFRDEAKTDPDLKGLADWLSGES